MAHYLFEDPTLGFVLAIVLEFLILLAWIFNAERFRKPALKHLSLPKF